MLEHFAVDCESLCNVNMVYIFNVHVGDKIIGLLDESVK